MPLTQQEHLLVRESLDAASTAELFAGSTRFYDNVFARDPGLRSMFREDLEGQGMRFMSTLKTIVDALAAPGGLQAAMADLGQTHRLLGIHIDMFDTMGEALIETFSQLLEDDFTPELDAAWRKAYGEIAKAMIAAGGIDTA